MAFLSAAGISATTLLTAGSAAVSGVTGLLAGVYAKNTADMNAEIAEDNAKRAVFRSQVEQQESDLATAGMLGEQEAAQSASGISLTSGSLVKTRAAARKLGRLDALNIRQAGRVEAYNYQAEAAGLRAKGQGALFAGVGDALGSFMSAGGSLIGGANSVKNPSRYGDDKWYGLRRKTA